MMEGLRVRPFGENADDLNVDFNLRPRPLLETEILTRCVGDGEGKPLSADDCWAMELGQRIALLVTVACAGGPGEISIAITCPAVDCGQALETELTVEEIAEAHQRAVAEPTGPVMLGGEGFTFRRPTGTDQLAWLGQRFPDRASATRGMAESLLEPKCREVFRQITWAEDGWLAVVEEALEARDPLVHARVTADCPVCGTSATVPVDLAGLALAQMRRTQHDLFELVHLLASRYHWSESEIFAVPPWRRARYRAMLETES